MSCNACWQSPAAQGSEEPGSWAWAARLPQGANASLVFLVLPCVHTGFISKAWLCQEKLHPREDLSAAVILIAFCQGRLLCKERGRWGGADYFCSL